MSTSQKSFRVCSVARLGLLAAVSALLIGTASTAQGQAAPAEARGNSIVEVLEFGTFADGGHYKVRLNLEKDSPRNGYYALALNHAQKRVFFVPLTTNAVENRRSLNRLVDMAGLERGGTAQPGVVSAQAVRSFADQAAARMQVVMPEGPPPICEQCNNVCSGRLNVSVDVVDPVFAKLSTTSNNVLYENRDTPSGCEWWVQNFKNCHAFSPTIFGTNWFTQSCSSSGDSGTIDYWSKTVTGKYYNYDFLNDNKITRTTVNLTVSGPIPLPSFSLSASGEWWWALSIVGVHYLGFSDNCYS